jgi:hypothetical protein
MLTDCPVGTKQSLTGKPGGGKAGVVGVQGTLRRDHARVSTVTVADRYAGKVVGKPYWGKPAVRFDEGAGGIMLDVGAHPGA